MHAYIARYTTAKIIALATVCQILLGCDGKGEKIDRVLLKIIFTRLPANLLNDNNTLAAESVTFLSGIIIDSKTCKDTVILDPTLIRADIAGSDTSIAYSSKKSPLSRVTAKREFKLLEEHLQKLVIPASMTGKPISKSDSLFRSYVISNNDLSADSLVVYSTNKRVDSLEINLRKYKAFSDIGSVRKQIETILCSNPKATIALLIDPPSTSISPQVTITDIRQDCNVGTLTVQAVGGDGSPITYGIDGLSSGQSSNKFTLPKDIRNGKLFAVFAMQNGKRVSKQFTTKCQTAPPVEPRGITSVMRKTWTRVAGSNFCVSSCVLAYTERDNLGHTRERRIENYAGCCPANN